MKESRARTGSASRSVWPGKVVLVTGVCGTVGRELLNQVSKLGVAEVTGIDNNETELFFLRECYSGDPRIRLRVGDVRDANTLRECMAGVDYVIHAAAYKHVILSEEAPRNVVQVNILGTANIIDIALEMGVQRVLFTSSDKAVNPTNVMGTSKLMGERLITAANANRRGALPVLASVRFGNILGSRGSVIPIFREQIAHGGPVTLTDARMTRFIMGIRQAARLVIDAVHLMCGGEVFVTKMPTVRIADLADVLIAEYAPASGYQPSDIAVRKIGAKAGEKLYEELLSDEETQRAVELPQYFVVLPAFRAVYRDIKYHYPRATSASVDRPYNSSLENPLTKEELRRFLVKNELIDAGVG